MEVKNPLVFLNKKGSSITKTFITNLFIGLIAFALFSGVAAIASAQDETKIEEDDLSPIERREAKQANLQKIREEHKEVLDDRRETIASRTDAVREQVVERKENFASRTEEVREKIQEKKAVLSERIKNRILALAENVSYKMRAAIGRLTQIISRFETRIDTLEEKGVDGSAAQAKLDEAKDQLARATEIIESEVNNHIDNTVGSDNPREAWAAGRAKFQEAREAIKGAHQAIRDALGLLKEAIKEAGLDQGSSDAVSQSDEPNSATSEITESENEENNQ